MTIDRRGDAVNKITGRVFENDTKEEIRELSIKLSEINMGNEFFVTLVSIAATIYVSSQLNILQYWDISFKLLFGIWVIWTTITSIYRSNKKQSRDKENGDALPRSVVEYRAEVIIGKNIYPGITAFGLLGGLSAMIYISSHLNVISKNLTSIMNLDIISTMLFFGALVLLIFRKEKYFLDLARRLPYLNEDFIELGKESPMTLVLGYIFAAIVLMGMALGVLFGFESFLSLSVDQKFLIIILMVFQYISIWTLAVLVNKSQIHRDLVNALNSLIDFQIQNESSQNQYKQFVELLKYTDFRRGTQLWFLDYYLYIPNPKYEAWLQQQEQNPKALTDAQEETGNSPPRERKTE